MNSKEAWTRMTNLVRREGYSAQKPVTNLRYNDSYNPAWNRAAYIAQRKRKGSFINGGEGVIHVTFSKGRYELNPVVGTYEDRIIALSIAEVHEGRLNSSDFQLSDSVYHDASYSPRMPGYTVKNPLIRGRNSDNQERLVAEAIKIADKPFRRVLHRGGLVLANTGGVYEIFRTKSSPNGYDVRFVADMEHPRQLTEAPDRDVAIMHFRRLLDQVVPSKGIRR